MKRQCYRRAPVIDAMALAVLSLTVCGSASADLSAYFQKPEPMYKWDKQGERTVGGGKVFDLHLVSQVWQGITWEHRLILCLPPRAAHPHFCVLLNTGGSGSDAEIADGMKMAKACDCAYAVLYDIPNQPLFGGKTEDALVVYTWLQFMQTGDESWPLHFPMAKAVLKAMDAIQDCARRESLPSINGFLITGGSKRGWTTWLDGASRDTRIKAIAPMVIDTLNVAAQGPHQLAAYGKYSEQIGDYTRVNMADALKTPRGKRLMELEDPYSYRELLTLPKLLVLGTNDRYWAQDALNLYWDGLKSPKWVLYTPNSGHHLEDRARVNSTLSAFARAVGASKPWPTMRWSYSDAEGGADLHFASNIRPVSARLFHVEAPTQDFRDSRWTFDPVDVKDHGFVAHVSTPPTGYRAEFGEVTYDLDGHPFTLSTQIHILGAGK